MNSYYKFHGAGNDFILIDAIAGNTTPDAKKIETVHDAQLLLLFR
jgi:diaminopimelate epimerase